MNQDLEASRPRHPVVRRAAAGLILIGVVALAIHFVVGLIMTIFWIVIAVAAAAAVIWALRNI